MSQSVLIIGAGHGGSTLAASLRQAGFEGDIQLIGAEPSLPYHRPPLSKTYLVGDQTLEKMAIRPAQFYQDQHIDMRVGTEVVALDIAAHQAELDSGETLEWGNLVFATGSAVRRLPAPGADLDGIHYLRTLADADRIKADMEDAQAITIVGGGYIGLEMAASLRKAGKAVRILEMEQRILQRVTSEPMSAFYHGVHTSQGVEIFTEKTLSEFAAKHGRVCAALCQDGDEFPTDMAIIGIGVVPVTALAEAAGIKCENGILVDERCRTSATDVWAIGDCTNHPNPKYGRRMRLESVPNAMEQARVVADNILGKDRTHDSIPWFWSDQYDLKLQMAGFSAGADDTAVRGDVGERKFARFYWREGALIGVDAVNSPQEFMLCRKLLATGATPDPKLLTDPSTNLKSLL